MDFWPVGTPRAVAALRAGPQSFPMRLLLLTLALALGACGDAATDAAVAGDPDREAPVATTSPDLPLVEVASAEALVNDLDDLDADIVVLNFWATWCGPCRLEFPEFIRFDREMDDENVHVRFVSLDQPVDLPLVQSFLKEHELDDPSYLYTGQGDVTAQLNPFVGGSIPITMVLDGDGIVPDTHVGRMSYSELAETVATIREGGDPDQI